MAVWALLGLAPQLLGQEAAGSIRGLVLDKDFDAPLPAAKVLIVETGQTTLTTDQGNYVFNQVPAGRYTLVFSKDGYVRQVRADVVVSAGQLTDLNASMSGEFTDMEEFVVQDIQFAGTEASLLQLRFESPAIMDSISSDLMSRAGASVQDGKFAVIRGLPDRYVSSQVNGVVLPSADENTRAVELDQFPSAIIDSIQVSKTFTPDQQGTASGGAVNVVTKTIPDQPILQFKAQYSYNTNVADAGDEFLSYKGGGLSRWGHKHDPPQMLGESWDGAVGTSLTDNPTDYKLSGAMGGSFELDNGIEVGAFASLFYEVDSSYYDDGQNDSWWVTQPGGPLVPKTNQGTPEDGDFKTALFDVTQGVQTVQWGGLGALGARLNEYNELGVMYQYTYTTEDKATLAEDTRGKQYFFPGYSPDDPMGPGNISDEIGSAPYLRTQTLDYTERSTNTLQFSGEHSQPLYDPFDLGDLATIYTPELDWTISKSKATLDEPDKTQFGSLWHPESFNPGAPPFVPPFVSPESYFPYKPGANFNLGNVQHIYKNIEETSDQYSFNLEVPFDNWDGDEGYMKVGMFEDTVDRTFDQDSYSNFGDFSTYQAGWNDFWSDVFPDEDHPIEESLYDVDYDGSIKVSAYYYMADLPVAPGLSLIGGARQETTSIGIVNDPEENALWYPPGSEAPVDLNPGDADVDFEQRDVLPSIGLVYEATEEVTLRASYSETVARQTFKELTPIIQQEFLGGPVFIGNPDLQMSSIDNYDLRADYKPYAGGLLSASWFKKDIEDPIEYVQRIASFTYTTPVNYPEGELNGWEFEARQDIGYFWESWEGLSVGANATFIHSEVTLPKDEQEDLAAPNIDQNISTRDATGAPDYLYNLYLTYDWLDRTQISLFYTVTGDTLVAGAGESDGNFIPDVYSKEYGTLNLTVSHKLTESSKLQFQAKNLTNPDIETYYSGDGIEGGDKTKTSFSRGREFSLSYSLSF